MKNSKFRSVYMAIALVCWIVGCNPSWSQSHGPTYQSETGESDIWLVMDVHDGVVLDHDVYGGRELDYVFGETTYFQGEKIGLIFSMTNTSGCWAFKFPVVNGVSDVIARWITRGSRCPNTSR